MHEQRVRFVLRARELGFWLDEIRALLRLVDERDRPCAEARAVAATHLQDVRAKIADLKRMSTCSRTSSRNAATAHRLSARSSRHYFRESLTNRLSHADH
jgi:MerR family mercuric resistance operon transcriptional regulator